MALILEIGMSLHGRRMLSKINTLRYTFIAVNIKGNQIKTRASVSSQKFFSTKSNNDNAASQAMKTRQQIYYGTLSSYVRNIKLFSLLTSVIGGVCQPFIYQKAAELGSTATVIGLSSFVGFFTIGTPLLLHFITKKYVTHLYYDAEKDEYIATTYTFFVRKRQLEFTPDDVTIPDIPGMFTSLRVKDVPMFLEAKSFEDLNHYKRIMGYDKPLDLKLGTDTPIKIEEKTHTQ